MDAKEIVEICRSRLDYGGDDWGYEYSEDAAVSLISSALSAQAAEVERLRGALINCYDDLYSLAYVHNKAFETAEGLRDFAESSYKRAKEAASLPPAAPEPTPSKEVPHAD